MPRSGSPFLCTHGYTELLCHSSSKAAHCGIPSPGASQPYPLTSTRQSLHPFYLTRGLLSYTTFRLPRLPRITQATLDHSLLPLGGAFRAFPRVVPARDLLAYI